MNIEVSNAKGTHDWLPQEYQMRNRLTAIIKSFFERFGFVGIETPALERTDTLLGKYGEEGDKLIFKILPRGAKLNEWLQHPDPLHHVNQYAEESLRYDLTVPFARFVVQHRHQLYFPFKRYQIQPVWRADRPQKGRYREFYQCDADIIGSPSLLNEVELIQLYDKVFHALHLNVIIKINHRKLLAGLAEIIKAPDKLIPLTVALDKLDKIGPDGVKEELRSQGFSSEQIHTIAPLLTEKEQNSIDFLINYFKDTSSAQQGLEELHYVIHTTKTLGLSGSQLIPDLMLARGLNYYTGCIFEVQAEGIQFGSIGGGGRYDNLTGIFGLPGVSGVGISFGIDRIIDVLKETGKSEVLLEPDKKIKCLIANFGEKEIQQLLPLIAHLRQTTLAFEVYPDAVKLKKQLQYAHHKSIPYVLLAGETELNKNSVIIKNMVSGEQKEITLEKVITYLQQLP